MTYFEEIEIQKLSITKSTVSSLVTRMKTITICLGIGRITSLDRVVFRKLTKLAIMGMLASEALLCGIRT